MGGEPLTAFGDDPNFIVNKQIRGLFCCRVAHTHTVTVSQSVAGMKWSEWWGSKARWHVMWLLPSCPPPSPSVGSFLHRRRYRLLIELEGTAWWADGGLIDTVSWIDVFLLYNFVVHYCIFKRIPTKLQKPKFFKCQKNLSGIPKISHEMSHGFEQLSNGKWQRF